MNAPLPHATSDLHAACEAALAAADRLVDAMRVALRARLGGDADASNREQARTHGFAWAATYCRALREMLKGLDGITTHEASKLVEVFANDQDIARLAGRVRPRLLDTEKPLKHGFLLERHGLYAWGKSLAEARRHIEIFEFLFEVLGRKLQGG